MAILSIATLKARFRTKDRPTEQDMDDLIDSLSGSIELQINSVPLNRLVNGSHNYVVMANNAGVATWSPLPDPPATLPPDGPAGGGLAGNYPNPVIKPGTNGQLLYTLGGVTTWAEFQTKRFIFTRTFPSTSGVIYSGDCYPTLGGRPDIVRWSLVCKSTAGGHSFDVGDELELLGLPDKVQSEEGQPVTSNAFQAFVLATAPGSNVTLLGLNLIITPQVQIVNKSGTRVTLNSASLQTSFDLRAVAIRF